MPITGSSFQGRRKIEIQTNSSSMTDLVFLLLIFFIVLSLYANTQQMQVDLPSTKESQSVQVNQPKVTISIDKTSQYFINKRKIDTQQLEIELLKLLKSGNIEQQVVLVVDKTVPTQETIHALSVVKKHKWKVALSTQQK